MTAELESVMLLAAGTRWDGEISRVLRRDGRTLERTGHDPGQVLVFGPTGAEAEVVEVYHVRGGERRRTVRCSTYSVVGERRYHH